MAKAMDTPIKEEQAVVAMGSEKKAQHSENSAPPEESRNASQTFAVMASLCLAIFLAALDVTIVATALPTISENFQLSESDYSWVAAAYNLAAAAFAPLWGKLSDIWGRKPILLVANVLFFVGSLVSGLAKNANMLIGGRTLQGVGGGGLIILVNICVGDLFSMRVRGKYYGIVGGVWAVAGALGPIIGGALTERVSWRWCFLVNLPTIGLTFPVLILFLKIHTPHTPVLAGLRAIDWAGVVLIIGGTTMVLLGLQFGGITFPWRSATVIALIVVGVITVGLFFLVEWKVASWPVIPLRIFRHRSNLAALGTGCCQAFMFIAGSYFLPLYFQTVLGRSPIMSGVYLFPFIISLSISSMATGFWIKRTGHYLSLIRVAIALQTLGFGLFITFPGHASWPRLIVFQIIAGLGTGPNFQAPLIALQTLVKGRDVAMATATYNFARQLSTSVSITIGSVVFQNQMAKHRTSLIQTLGSSLGSFIAEGDAGASIPAVSALPGSQKLLVTSLYTEAFKTMWVMYVCFGALGVLLSFGITSQALSAVHEEVKTGLGAREEERRARRQEEDNARVGRMESDKLQEGERELAEEKVVEDGTDV